VSADGEGVPGTLFVVSTPIGHLGDLSPRAVEVLGQVAAKTICQCEKAT